MKQKGSVSIKSEFKIMNEVLDILRRRSEKAIDLARKELLTMNLEERGREALKHYVMNWDDTSHPGILSLACEAVGGRSEKVVRIQVATLVLTAAMDIHDDVIDHSRTKNGKITVFGKFGRDTALLVGDALWLEGFMLLHAAQVDFPHETEKAIANAIKQNFDDVGNAHLLELALREKLDVSPSTYMRVLEMKASNISIHTTIGAIVGGGSQLEISSLKEYGKILGMLVTLREEFIDIFEPEELRNRAKNECLPLPLLYAMEDADSKNLVISILSKTKTSEKDSETIVRIVFESKRVQVLKKRMEKWSKEALLIVSKLRKSEATDALSRLVVGALEDL